MRTRKCTTAYYVSNTIAMAIGSVMFTTIAFGSLIIEFMTKF